MQIFGSFLPQIYLKQKIYIKVNFHTIFLLRQTALHKQNKIRKALGLIIINSNIKCERYPPNRFTILYLETNNRNLLVFPFMIIEES